MQATLPSEPRPSTSLPLLATVVAALGASALFRLLAPSIGIWLVSHASFVVGALMLCFVIMSTTDSLMRKAPSGSTYLLLRRIRSGAALACIVVVTPTLLSQF